MSKNNQILQWLNHLRILIPPTGVTLIGAGCGTGEWPLLLNSWEQPNVTMVEADEKQYWQLEKAFPQSKSWRFENRAIAKENTDTDYYFLSNSLESGLLDPEALRELWPNITLREKLVKVALTLDELQKDSAVSSNWLFIDCLPFLPILHGAEKSLKDMDIVVGRCLLDPTGEQLENEASKKSLDAFLSAQGFRCLSIQKERHASIGHALFIRDSYAQIKELRITNAATEQQLNKAAEDLKIKTEITGEEKLAKKQKMEKTIAEISSKLAVSEKENEELKKQVGGLKVQIENGLETETSKENILSNLTRDSAKTTSVSRVFSSDANLDDFLNDIAPFFFGKSITYVDIGAFIGKVFLKLHQSDAIKIREAHLYEPNPVSYADLKNNINGCDVSDLHSYNISISCTPGEALFSAAQSMTKKIRVPLDKEMSTNTFNVESYSLDELDLIMTDRRIDLLKIDVEGEELDVLESARHILKDQRVDVLYIEAGLNQEGTQQTYFADLDMFMQNHGYRIFKIYEQVNEWVQDSPLLRRCNIAYMSLKFANANPLKASKEIKRLKKEVASLKTMHAGHLA